MIASDDSQYHSSKNRCLFNPPFPSSFPPALANVLCPGCHVTDTELFQVTFEFDPVGCDFKGADEVARRFHEDKLLSMMRLSLDLLGRRSRMLQGPDAPGCV